MNHQLRPVRDLPGFEEAYKRCKYAFELVGYKERLDALEFIKANVEVDTIDFCSVVTLRELCRSYSVESEATHGDA